MKPECGMSSYCIVYYVISNSIDCQFLSRVDARDRANIHVDVRNRDSIRDEGTTALASVAVTISSN